MNINNIGIVILRFISGFTFFIHGISKFHDIANTVVFFESIGIFGFVAYLVAIIELIGGIMLILGIGTRVISLLFAVIMVGAIVKVKFQVGYIGDGKNIGYELELALLVISIFLFITNDYIFSLGNLISHDKDKK